ncbi:MAG TPA: transglutaminase-like domain-containing protein [Syntrophales bacterium]|nr:transglutaminase-like domain-containing protein [Syntrophales bacterium]HOX95467.1 transglutaminase-like domain-containing protein [Syntrophales bacterium]HPI56473.1 transglutaminase-like domain-containing protein [Syntrophales bacterium]HPN25106.1 transglutaminase-like domain-containing protein [Syntrophales bacterium]HQM29151.1 transglutaminase-like domain-containing protein [Syntrophales bacterium]
MARADSAPVKKCASALFALLVCLSILSCTSFYFQTLQPPSEKIKLSGLGDLSWREQWAGIVFNGEKVGFTFLKMMPLDERDLFLISSEAHMRLRFLGVEKRLALRSADRVRNDLQLVSFRYDMEVDGKTLLLEGENREGRLEAVRQTNGERKTIVKEVGQPLYPASAVNFYPFIAGIAVGSKYRYDVFDPQAQAITEVLQSVDAFENSPKLLIEPSFKVETSMLGQAVTSWISPAGETIFELAMGGALITYKEDENRARQFLYEASMNKKDLILDFSLVRTDRTLSCPRQASYLKIALEGVAGQLPLLEGPGQAVTETNESGRPVALYVLGGNEGPDPPRLAGAFNIADRYIYLAATDHIESDHPEIVREARAIVIGAPSDLDKIRRLAKWVSLEVRDEVVDSFSALEVLHTKKGECQAHTLLYAALARASGIPTRLAGGLVYLEGTGFLYHAWAESYADGWIAVDPTFDQVGIDATHIKLAEGPSWISMMGIGKVVGQVRAGVLDYRALCRD